MKCPGLRGIATAQVHCYEVPSSLGPFSPLPFFINNIEFKNFRNFSEYKISFENKVNILFGDNGCGKTNVLEGISLIADI